VTLKLRRTSAPDLAVCLKGKLDGPFFKRAERSLERLTRVPALPCALMPSRRISSTNSKVCCVDWPDTATGCTSSLTNACARWCTSTRRCSTWCSRDASTSRRAVYRAIRRRHEESQHGSCPCSKYIFGEMVHHRRHITAKSLGGRQRR
jgi:hypothetical protein